MNINNLKLAKMRTFRLIGMALIAMLMCVNFTACSSDDEIIKDDDGVVTNEKKLVEIKMTNNSEIITWDFSYGTKGKLASITCTEKYEYETDIDITNIIWGDNTVMESENGESITYSINDGLIRSGSESGGRDYSFAYNSSKQLTTYQYSNERYSNSRTLIWENGKVTKMTYEKDEPSTITYGNQTCKGFFPLMVLMVEDDFKLMLAHPELVGMRTTQLPTQINSKDDYYETTEKYTYTLNKDRYVESCTMIYTEKRLDTNETDTSTDIYTFKWE